MHQTPQQDVLHQLVVSIGANGLGIPKLPMLTKTEALKIVSKKLRQMSTSTDPFIVAEESTIEKPFGWVFFYNSKKFLDTRISQYRLAGNGPVIVNKTSGTVEFHESDKPPEDLINEYERKLDSGDT